jgi:hypothetical protein
VRGFQDGRDPERTERQLRAARAVSDARREGRVFEGFCLDPPTGFRIEEALRIYGGERAVEENCSVCPANALARFDPATLAGCYGLVTLPNNSRPVHDAVEQSIATIDAQCRIGQLFPISTPRWYGLWMESPLAGARAGAVAKILSGAMHAEPAADQSFDELIGALEYAAATSRPLHVRHYPPGQVTGPWWQLVPHCCRCHASWNDASARKCTACGYIGHAAREKKRHARGRRPYFSLDRLIGEQAAAELFARFRSAVR